MVRRRRKKIRPLTEQDCEALNRLLFTFDFGYKNDVHSLAAWAVLLYNGKVNEDKRIGLEHSGIKLEHREGKDITLHLANYYLRQREKELGLLDLGVETHFNVLLRRIGGRSVGAVRFAGKPHRSTCLTFRKNRYKPQVNNLLSSPLHHVLPGLMINCRGLGKFLISLGYQ